MDFNKDEFNEYGVRTNYQQTSKTNSQNPKIGMIIAVTVLFSVFNFVVGYMIGKFLGNSTNKNITEISYLQQTNNTSEILGIPSSKTKETTQIKEDEGKITLDLEEPLIDTNPPSAVKDYKTTKNTTTKEKIGESLIDTNPPSAVKDYKTTKNTTTKEEVGEPKKPTQKFSSQTPISKKQSEKITSSPKQDVKQKKGPTTINDSTKQVSTSVKYFIQVSSNEKKDIAESTLKKLEALGLNGFIQEVNVGGKKLYRVKVGAFESYDDAVKELEKAKKINNNAFLVVSK